MVGHPLAQIEQAAETVSFCESYGVWRQDDGSIGSDSVLSGGSGSTLLDCDAWKLPGRRKPSSDPTDNFPECGDFTASDHIPPKGHTEQGCYAFADSHVKSLRWTQIRANDFRLFKLQKPTQTFTP